MAFLLPEGEEFLKKISGAVADVKINKELCLNLVSSCDMIGDYMRTWGLEFQDELDTRPHLVQELVRMLSRCYRLVGSCGVKGGIMPGNMRNGFKLAFEDLWKCVDLINKGLAQEVDLMNEGLAPELKLKAITELQENAAANSKYIVETDDHESIELLDLSNEEPIFVKKLGQGAFGEVNLKKFHGYELAVKSPVDMNAENINVPPHPHIVEVIGHIHNQSLVMEVMDSDLFHYMEKMKERKKKAHSRPFSLLEAVDAMLQIARGMEHLHNKKVIHRDLKPLNVLVRVQDNTDLILKVADFGLSLTKFTTNATNSFRVGTTRYMAPEMFGGDPEMLEDSGHYSRKIDVYSYAITCWEILTGCTAFQGVDISNVSKAADVIKVQNRRPEIREGDCPEVLRQLITACWDADTSRRKAFDYICKELSSLKAELLLKRLSRSGDTLFENQRLNVGQKLTSNNGSYWLELEKDGNLVLYRRSDGCVLWRSGTTFTNFVEYFAIMQTDGNFVVYSGSKPVWATRTVWMKKDHYRLVMQDDGNLILYTFLRDVPNWSSDTSEKGRPSLGMGGSYPDTLSAGQQLSIGQRLRSKNGRYWLVMEREGNLVLYQDSDRRVLWKSTSRLWNLATRDGAWVESLALLKPDGKLVISHRGKDWWSSNGAGKEGTYKLALQDDGNLALYASSNQEIWSSKDLLKPSFN